jgi:hypothetical protein
MVNCQKATPDSARSSILIDASESGAWRHLAKTQRSRAFSRSLSSQQQAFCRVAVAKDKAIRKRPANRRDFFNTHRPYHKLALFLRLPLANFFLKFF